MKRLGLILFGLGISWMCLASEINFDELVANPKRYNGKQVTITGLADIEGDGFWVWKDGRALKHADVDHAIFIAHEIPPEALFSPYARANLHFVKVTGIVDTNIHGHLGMDPFSIVLKNVEVLPGPRQKQYLPIVAWFHNETGELLYLHVTVRTGYVSTAVAAYGLTETEVDKSSVAEIRRTRFGQLLFSRKLLTRQSGKTYYDPKRKAYYFRITNSAIEPAPTEQAKQWKFPPTPESD